MESINDIATYPMKRDNWLTTVLVGGILVFLSFLVIPIILVYGYVIQVIRDTQQGRPEPPAFGDWGTLLVDGVKAWVIGIVYMLVPAIVATITVGGALTSLALEGNLGATLGALLFGFLISAVLGIVFGYVAVAAIVNFAREDRLGAGFDFTVLKQVALHRDYAVAWLAALLVFVVAGIVTALPLVGWIVGPFASFYAITIAGNLWSSGVSAALDSTDTVERASSEQPAA